MERAFGLPLASTTPGGRASVRLLDVYDQRRLFLWVCMALALLLHPTDKSLMWTCTVTCAVAVCCVLCAVCCVLCAVSAPLGDAGSPPHLGFRTILAFFWKLRQSSRSDQARSRQRRTRACDVRATLVLVRQAEMANVRMRAPRAGQEHRADGDFVARRLPSPTPVDDVHLSPEAALRR